MGRATYLLRVRGPSCLTGAPRPRTMAPVPRTRLLALVLAGIAAAAAPAAAQTRADGSLPHRLARALAVPHVHASETGAIAVDLASGRPIFARNPGLSLAPASTEKLTVTYAALALLGPAFRFQTDVVGEGEQRGASWIGSLVLQGHGDPGLSSGDLRDLAAQLRAAGIRRVTGDLVGDESWFDARRTAPGWKSYYYIGESAPL